MVAILAESLFKRYKVRVKHHLLSSFLALFNMLFEPLVGFECFLCLDVEVAEAVGKSRIGLLHDINCQHRVTDFKGNKRVGELALGSQGLHWPKLRLKER